MPPFLQRIASYFTRCIRLFPYKERSTSVSLIFIFNLSFLQFKAAGPDDRAITYDPAANRSTFIPIYFQSWNSPGVVVRRTTSYFSGCMYLPRLSDRAS